MPGALQGAEHQLLPRAESHGDDPEAFGRWAADQIEEEILFEGPETVAAVFLEPVQNAGGCFPPPPGYFQRVREICDKYDVLLVSDEVICAFGRLGTMFACDKFGYVPDMITCAKGMTLGLLPDRRLHHLRPDRRAVLPRRQRPSSTATPSAATRSRPRSALANLDIFEREDLNQHVLRQRGAIFRATLEKLHDLPIVGDVRGDGYFFGIELVKDKATKETFTTRRPSASCTASSPRRCSTPGCTAAPTTAATRSCSSPRRSISDQALFDEIEGILRAVLTEAWTKL